MSRERIPYSAEQNWLTEPEPDDLEARLERAEEKADIARDREIDDPNPERD